MRQKLTPEKLDEVLETGIRVFAAAGFENAGMSDIARQSGLSVGVLYKYYESKEAFFRACVHRSTAVLEEALRRLTAQEAKPLEYARALIGAARSYSRDYGDHVRLYHALTGTADAALAAVLAAEVEGVTARLYTDFIARAQAAGDVRADLDPRLFAFFFDNLLMMMQFSYCCPYYQERLRLYGGGDTAERDEAVASQLLRFLESAFTFEQTDILHKTEA